MIIKVADFGLSVNTGDKDYFRLTEDTGTKLPVMWVAPESLTDYVFSEMSDVVRMQAPHAMIINFLLSRCTQYVVELWSNMLGDIHWRSSSLCWY